MAERNEKFEVEDIMKYEDIFHRFGQELSLTSNPEHEEIHGGFNNTTQEKSPTLNAFSKLSITEEEQIAEDRHEEASESRYDIKKVPDKNEARIAEDRQSENDFKKVPIHGGVKNKNEAEDLREEASQSEIVIKIASRGWRTAENLHEQRSRSVKIAPIHGEFKIGIEEEKTAEDRLKEASHSLHDFNGGFKNKIAEDVHKEESRSKKDIMKVPITEAKMAEDRHKEPSRSEYGMKRGPKNGNLQEFNSSVSGEWKIAPKKKVEEVKPVSESVEGLDEILRKYTNIFVRLDELFSKAMKKEQVDSDEEGDGDGEIKDLDQE